MIKTLSSQLAHSIVLYCRQECIDLKKINQEQQNVIIGLKKDLAGAQARLSVST